MFWSSALTDKAAVNVCAQEVFTKIPLGERLDHTVNVYLTFSEIARRFSKVVIPFTFPLVACKSSSYSTSLSTLDMVNF